MLMPRATPDTRLLLQRRTSFNRTDQQISLASRMRVPVLCGAMLGFALTGAPAGWAATETAPAPLEQMPREQALGEQVSRERGPDERAEPLLVEAVIAEFAPVVHHHEISGEIVAAESFTVAFRDGGRVETMDIETGDHVSPGQVIARIDSAQADAAVGAASAGLLAAEASLKQAQLARDRAEALAERGAGTRADLDLATQVLLSVQATRDQAQVRLDKASQALQDTMISANVRAIVTERLAQRGQIVGPAQPVLRMARDGLREAVFYVPDTADLTQVMGTTMRVRTLDWPQIEMRAVVTEIAPLVEQATGTVRVEARLEAADPSPALGAAVAGTMDWSSAPVVSLPASAIAVTAQGPAVWRIDPASFRVSLVNVKLARHEAQTVAIESGLDAGDLIVTEGSQMLYPDRQVRLQGAPQ